MLLKNFFLKKKIFKNSDHTQRCSSNHKLFAAMLGPAGQVGPPTYPTALSPECLAATSGAGTPLPALHVLGCALPLELSPGTPQQYTVHSLSFFPGLFLTVKFLPPTDVVFPCGGEGFGPCLVAVFRSERCLLLNVL